MSNKIVLYKGAEKQMQIEGVLSKYLEENNIPFEMHRVPGSQQFLMEFLLKDDFLLLW